MLTVGGHELALGYVLGKATSELHVRERQFGKTPPGTYKRSGLHLISNFKTTSQSGNGQKQKGGHLKASQGLTLPVQLLVI